MLLKGGNMMVLICAANVLTSLSNFHGITVSHGNLHRSILYAS